MIRRTQLTISYANKGKLQTLDSIFEEAKRVINEYISLLWAEKDFSSKFITKEYKINSWFSARMKQCLGKQALGIVKSQRKRKKKTKPVFTKNTINLDSRFFDIRFDSNTYDVWIKFTSIGNKIKLNLPSKKHKHFNKYLESGWKLKNSLRLRNCFIDLYFEKKSPVLKPKGKSLGIDIGYKKLIATSDKQVYGTEFPMLYKKISRKTQGSKGFKRALVERDQIINKAINELDLTMVSELVVEDLKNVKRSSKICHKFMNKLQRWSYPKVLNKLSRACEESGIVFTKVNPAYTSQICNKCGHIDSKSRKGELFQCVQCNYVEDADINAAVNIVHRGVYSPSQTNTKLKLGAIIK